jgi:hypothetical protein
MVRLDLLEAKMETATKNGRRPKQDGLETGDISEEGFLPGYQLGRFFTWRGQCGWVAAAALHCGTVLSRKTLAGVQNRTSLRWRQGPWALGGLMPAWRRGGALCVQGTVVSYRAPKALTLVAYLNSNPYCYVVFTSRPYPYPSSNAYAILHLS